jgi:hypothetical protein
VANAQNAGTAYEASDVSPRLVGWIGLGIAGSVAGLCLLLALVFPAAIQDRPKLTPIEPPPPRLQTDPQAELRALEAAATERLSSYGWADRDRNIVHIPIDEAMALVARRGIDGWTGDQN